MKSFNSEKLIIFVSFGFVIGYIIFALLIPFILQNGLESWDFPGLKASIEYQKDILPKLSDFNPTFFFGYTQNQFYPPLFSYVGALLSYIFSATISLKILFSISLLLLPISFYYFLRGYNLSKEHSAALMLVMFSILFLVNGYSYGGNMDSTFRVGLITHVLGMVFFFFYAGRLNKDYQENKFLFASILFSLAILTHIIAAFACVIYFLANLVSNLHNKNKIGLYFIKHIGLVFLITAAWILPFIFKINYLNSQQIGFIDSKILMILVAIWLIYFLFKENTIFLNLGMFFVGIFLFNFVYIYILKIPIHMYRFYMYLCLLVPLMVYSVISKKYLNRMMVLLIIISVMVIAWNPINTSGVNSKLEITSNYSFDKNERVLVLPKLTEGRVHYLQNEVPELYGFNGVRGLYVESSRNARSAYNLESVLNNKQKYSMGAPIDSEVIDYNNFSSEKVYAELSYLGINKVIADDQIKYGLQEEELFSIEGIKDYLYSFNKSEIVEIWTKEIKRVNRSEDKDLQIANWFLGDNILKETLIMDEFPEYKLNGNENLVLKNISESQKKIEFEINSENNVPVLIKYSYLPNWKAYSNGEEIQIYEVAPSLMMIFSKGEITLEYRMLWMDKIGYLLSAFGIILTIYLIFKRKFIS